MYKKKARARQRKKAAGVMKDCVEEKSAVKQVNREVSKQTKTSNNKRNERRCENYIIDSVIGCFFLQHSIILRETGLVV